MGVKFIALVSKELKNEFCDAFSQYKKSTDSLYKVDPNIVKQRAAVIVQKFFSKLSDEVKMLQAGVN